MANSQNGNDDAGTPDRRQGYHRDTRQIPTITRRYPLQQRWGFYRHLRGHYQDNGIHSTGSPPLIRRK